MTQSTNILMELSKEEKHHLKRGLVKSLRPLKYFNISKSPEDDAELYTAYKYTLKKYGFENYHGNISGNISVSFLKKNPYFLR